MSQASFFPAGTRPLLWGLVVLCLGVSLGLAALRGEALLLDLATAGRGLFCL